ncbi:MAG: ArnT family glycosyltransferase [Acidobacteriaceae bacterium]
MRIRFSRSAAIIGLALLAGFLLRILFVLQFPVNAGDGPIYSDIARNWFFHGIYGLSTNPDSGIASSLHPTIIRMPGYPFFLGLCFAIFGQNSYLSIMLVQVVLDLFTCLLIAAIARRLCGNRAAWWALWLAVLCPFTAAYTAAILTETLELLCTTAAFYCFLRLLDSTSSASPRWPWTALLALSATTAALLRPDGALIGVVLYPAIFIYGRKSLGPRSSLRHLAACMVLTAVPFSAWTIRNWRAFHVFQPLTTRYANEVDQSPNPGFNRWTSTVCADFTCTSEVYWRSNSGPIAFSSLPGRAFDSPRQEEETRQLIHDYNQVLTLTPSIDARFGQLAIERLHAHPLEYRSGLPLLRLADMWFRPRTATLPIALRWWQFGRHPGQTLFAYAYAALNLALLIAAIVGLKKCPRYSAVFVAFILLRCALLLTIEAPETRYTIECFPFILALAGIAFGGRSTSLSASSQAQL